MPTTDLVTHTALFVAAALALALATFFLRRDLWMRMVHMGIPLLAGFATLALFARLGAGVAEGTLATVVREGALLLVAIGFVRIAMIFAFQVALGNLAVPQILAEVLMALLLIVFAFFRMNAVGVNLAGIVTTSAVLTGVIAFSLQETLGNLWGGIALQLDNTCRIGDWIRMEGVMGQVVGIRWRYVAIATNNGETVIVPNSLLSKNRVTLLARRGDRRVPWRRDVEFAVSYDVPPARVIAAVDAALARAEIPYVAPQPAPDVIFANFGDNAFHYIVRYWLSDLREEFWTDSQVRLHVAAALARHGMEIPYPHRVLMRRAAVPAGGARDIAARCATLAALDLFMPLTGAERQALAADLVDCPYVAGDLIARQGEPADSLFILARGRVAVLDQGEPGSGKRNRLATLEAPGYFGEMGLLTGQARAATVVAENEVLCYRLDKAGFDAVLKARPELVEALSHVVAARQAANDATLETASADARARHAVGRAAELVRRIRGFFGIG